MADMKKLLHAFDEADEILNGKIERTNLSTIVASATASVENKKTVSIRGTGRNIEVLKVGGRTVQDGTPTPDAPVEVLGVGDYDEETGKYKIPVSCNGKTTNIYLDSPLFEGESADLVGGIKDKKLKRFTIETIIEDDWIYIDDTDHPLANRIYLDTKKSEYTPVFDKDYNDGCVPMCNYFKGQETIGLGTSTKDGCVNFGQLSNAKGMIRFGLYSSGIKSVSEFKAWLEERAAEGKPLTIWYESTEPTTESFDTSPIPTTSGNNELSIDTEVIPATIDVTSFGDYYSKAEVDAIVPRIAMLMYIGTGGTNTIKFPRFPTRVISMSGMAIDNNYIQSYPYDPKRVDSIKSKYYGGHMGEVSCSLSYDESESSITLTGGVDDGARFNVLGETYVVIYTY